jgi:hypothetical protein
VVRTQNFTDRTVSVAPDSGAKRGRSPVVVLVERDDAGLFRGIGLVRGVRVDAGQRVVVLRLYLGVLLGGVGLGHLFVERGIAQVLFIFEGLRVSGIDRHAAPLSMESCLSYEPRRS